VSFACVPEHCPPALGLTPGSATRSSVYTGPNDHTDRRLMTVDPTILAYIAGFLDGDCSVFFQVVRKTDYCLGFQIRSSIAFYQKTENERILFWLKERLAAGYIRRRKTGISDYTVVDQRDVRRILKLLSPYVRLKSEHVKLSLEILDQFPLGGEAAKLMLVSRLVDRFQSINYSKKRTQTSVVVAEHLRSRGFIAHVETDEVLGESPQHEPCQR